MQIGYNNPLRVHFSGFSSGPVCERSLQSCSRNTDPSLSWESNLLVSRKLQRDLARLAAEDQYLFNKPPSSNLIVSSQEFSATPDLPLTVAPLSVKTGRGRPQLRLAIEDTYQPFFEKITDKSGEDKGYHVALVEETSPHLSATPPLSNSPQHRIAPVLSAIAAQVPPGTKLPLWKREQSHAENIAASLKDLDLTKVNTAKTMPKSQVSQLDSLKEPNDFADVFLEMNKD